MCVRVCRWDSPDLLASSATAAPAIQLKSGEGGRQARLEREKRQTEGGERESPGPNKDMGARTGLGPALL